MKFFSLFFMLLLFCSNGVVAQLEKGRKLIGGEGWIYSVSESKFGNLETTTTFSLQPKFGYVMNPKDVIGIQTGFERSENNSAFVLAPFYRRYFRSEEQYGIFGEVMPSLVLDDFGTIIDSRVRFGFTYFLTPRFAFEGKLHLFSFAVEPEYSTFTTEIGISTNRLAMGVVFFF